MDRRERLGDLNEALLAAFDGFQATLWTAIPAVIQSFDPAKMTVQAQPLIQAQVVRPDGSTEWVTLPLLVDVPVFFPSGGGYTLTFPIQAGNEALILFSSRCIDAWWSSGQISVQAELRMHDLSDGFAFVGIRSIPKLLTGVSTSSVQLRNDAGDTFVEVEGTTVNIVANEVNVTAPNVNVTASGRVHVDSPELRCTGEVIARHGTPEEIGLGHFGDVYNTHTHNGVTPGIGNSGTPNTPAYP